MLYYKVGSEDRCSNQETERTTVHLFAQSTWLSHPSIVITNKTSGRNIAILYSGLLTVRQRIIVISHTSKKLDLVNGRLRVVCRTLHYLERNKPLASDNRQQARMNVIHAADL